MSWRRFPCAEDGSRGHAGAQEERSTHGRQMQTSGPTCSEEGCCGLAHVFCPEQSLLSELRDVYKPPHERCDLICPCTGLNTHSPATMAHPEVL